MLNHIDEEIKVIKNKILKLKEELLEWELVKLKIILPETNILNNEEKAKEFLEKRRWPNKIICPYCDSNEITSCIQPMPYRCKDCRKYFSVRIGTILNESKLPLHIWISAIYIFSVFENITSTKLSKLLGITQKTDWFLKNKMKSILIETDLELI